MGSYQRKRENKWISTGKNRGGGPTYGKEKTNGLVQVKSGVWDQPKEKRKTNGLVQVKTGVGGQPKEKRKQMD